MILLVALLLTIAAPLAHATQVTMDVKWVRVAAEGLPELREGTCHVYAPDHPRLLTRMWEQLDWCRRQPGPLTAPALQPGAVRITWIELPDITPLERDYFPHTKPSLGFFKRRGAACLVVTRTPERGYSAVGHEVKHCYDGHFHL